MQGDSSSYTLLERTAAAHVCAAEEQHKKRNDPGTISVPGDAPLRWHAACSSSETRSIDHTSRRQHGTAAAPARHLSRRRGKGWKVLLDQDWNGIRQPGWIAQRLSRSRPARRK